jgi:hypothetical protein
MADYQLLEKESAYGVAVMPLYENKKSYESQTRIRVPRIDRVFAQKDNSFICMYRAHDRSDHSCIPLRSVQINYLS